jgi:phage protein U
MIGSLGDVVFVVSAETMRTFDDFQRNTESRWGKHDIIGQKPKSEYLGPGLDTISFNVRLDASFGINPRKEMDALVELTRSGKAVPLIIGGKGLGINLWIIKSLSQKWTTVDNRGNVLIGSVDIELEEYV